MNETKAVKGIIGGMSGEILAIDECPSETIEESLPIIPQKIIDRTKKWIMSYFHDKGAMPSKKWIQKKVNTSENKTTDIFKILLKEEFIEKKGNRYYLTEEHQEKSLSFNPVKKIKKAIKLSPGMIILKIILFIIGCGASYMSIYHSIGFLSEYYSGVKPILSAIIMIGFNIIAAELIVFFYRKRHIALCSVFFILLVLGTIFSMGSTVIGLYNSRSADLTTTTIEENVESKILQETTLRYNNILERKEQAKIDLEATRKKRDNLVDRLSKYDTPEKIKDNQTDYNNLNWTRVLADRELTKLRESYDLIIQEEKEFLNTESVVSNTIKELPADAFIWIGNTIGMEPNKLQFVLSCYPAIFYDIIAPVAFSVVLFASAKPKAKKKKDKKKRRKKK